MKKVISLKELVMIIICMVLIVSSMNVFAINPSDILNNGSITITGDDYEDAQKNQLKNEANLNNDNNNASLPQTGIEDNVGILLIICVASAIFAYKKIKYYNV